MKRKLTEAEVNKDIARRLREFGYPDLTTEKIAAVRSGAKKDVVIEAFIKSMLSDYEGSP